MLKFLSTTLIRFCLFFLGLAPLSLSAQDTFYQKDSVQLIEIFFSFSNWDAKLDSAAATESYIIADSVRINGESFDSVGVKYKGNSTYSASNKKNPFHIELNHIKGNQDYQDYTDIKLSNCWSDPSFIREPLGYALLTPYMHCPKANFARVYVNNVYRGVYSNAETINKDFISRHYYASERPFFKCNKPNFQSTGNPNLVPSGWDSVNYYAQRYEMKSDEGWTRFITMMYALQNDTASVDTILDVDRALWMHAFNNLTVNLDSYTGGFIQNYYMSEDNNRRFSPTVWDLNMCFGSFTSLSSGAPLSISQMQQMSPTAQSTSTSRPLISKLLAKPRYKKQYIAHLRTMLNEMIVSNDYYTEAQALQNTIAPYVLTDTCQFYTYQKFLSNLDTAVVTTGTSTKIGLKQLMNNRKNYLLSHAEFQNAPPSLNTPVVNNTTPSLNSTVTVTTQTTNATSVYLGLRNENWKKFDRLPMYDDGNHNDGAAGDGNYGTSFVVNSGKMEYYVYVENNVAGIFSPARAEHEFYTLIADIPQIPAGSIRINEFMASNVSALADPSGAHPDWVEIYNTTNNTLSLSGLYLSDDLGNVGKWSFPVTSSIAPLSYFLIWCDQDTLQSGYHANFKLSTGGDRIILAYANGNIIDSVSFGPQISNISTGRCTNGTGSFIPQISYTPLAANNCPTGLGEYDDSKQILLVPNPASNMVRVMSAERLGAFIVRNISGQPVYSFENALSTHADFNVKNWPSGIYFVHFQSGKVIKFIVE